MGRSESPTERSARSLRSERFPDPNVLVLEQHSIADRSQRVIVHVVPVRAIPRQGQRSTGSTRRLQAGRSRSSCARSRRRGTCRPRCCAAHNPQGGTRARQALETGCIVGSGSASDSEYGWDHLPFQARRSGDHTAAPHGLRFPLGQSSVRRLARSCDQPGGKNLHRWCRVVISTWRRLLGVTSGAGIGAIIRDRPPANPPPVLTRVIKNDE